MRKEKNTWLKLFKQIRKPLPPPGKFHSTKKGAKGYNRAREKQKIIKEYDVNF
jgi:hypothetical protein